MHLIRFRFGLFLLAFAVFSANAGGELLNFVPAGAEYVISVDAEALQKLTYFKNLTGSRSDARVFLEDFERNYNLRLSDCTDLLFVGGGSRLRGLLAETSVPEPELAQRLRRFGSRFSIEGEAGRKLYCLRTDESIPGNRITVGVAYLGPRAVLATDRRYIAPFLTALAVPAEQRKTPLVTPKGEPLAWGFVDVGTILAGTKKSRADFGNAMLKGVNTVFAELNVIGDGDSWRLDAAAQCDNARNARQFALLVPAYLQVGASLLFSDDPALGREFLQQLKIMPDGSRVILELAVSRSLAERLARYLELQAKKRIAPPDPVPPDIKAQLPEGRRD